MIALLVVAVPLGSSCGFGLVGLRFIFFSFDQGFIQSSPNKILITSIMNLSQGLTLMDLRIPAGVSPDIQPKSIPVIFSSINQS